jgi:hypothetical protein
MAAALLLYVTRAPAPPSLVFESAISRSDDADDPLAAMGALPGPPSLRPRFSFDPGTGAMK